MPIILRNILPISSACLYCLACPHHAAMQQNVPQMIMNEDIVKALRRPLGGMKRAYAIEERLETGFEAGSSTKRRTIQHQEDLKTDMETQKLKMEELREMKMAMRSVTRKICACENSDDDAVHYVNVECRHHGLLLDCQHKYERFEKIACKTVFQAMDTIGRIESLVPDITPTLYTGESLMELSKSCEELKRRVSQLKAMYADEDYDDSEDSDEYSDEDYDEDHDKDHDEDCENSEKGDKCELPTPDDLIHQPLITSMFKPLAG
jgi:hypothetical protein